MEEANDFRKEFVRRKVERFRMMMEVVVGVCIVFLSVAGASFYVWWGGKVFTWVEVYLLYNMFCYFSYVYVKRKYLWRIFDD